ncbi:MAG: 50S ribosomal protein L10, partial [Candidatus Woesearchaeota archaeon]|nr:50S ribosomal protein L10 [Candidatus Woesearchaeota archaeon]
IGLNLTAVFEKGTVYPASVLDIDEEAFNQKLSDAIVSALNLGVEICYPAHEVLELLLAKAWREARAVARESHFLVEGMADEMLSSAESVAQNIKEELKI